MKYLLSAFILLLTAFSVKADEIRPAYLQLQQRDVEHYDVLWKVPGRGDNERLALRVEFPKSCKKTMPPRANMVNNAYIERWDIQCAGGLIGHSVHISGLPDTSTDVLVRVEMVDGSSQMERLTASTQSFILQASPDAFDVAHTYLVLGVEHILAGFDHLLFVLALLLIVGWRWKSLIQTITAFTLAHSITLALATLGFIHVPAAPVEAVIALSIVFVAAEILHVRAGQASLTARAPWLVAFLFGLLHGFGFAGALSEIGLPKNSVPLALFFFNIGVEVGQLIFVVSVSLIGMLLNRTRLAWPTWVEIVPPYVIGSCAAFWFIQRIAAF